MKVVMSALLVSCGHLASGWVMGAMLKLRTTRGFSELKQENQSLKLCILVPWSTAPSLVVTSLLHIQDPHTGTQEVFLLQTHGVELLQTI